MIKWTILYRVVLNPHHGLTSLSYTMDVVAPHEDTSTDQSHNLKDRPHKTLISHHDVKQPFLFYELNGAP